MIDAKLFLGSAILCEQNAKPSESIKGIPYKNLKIGVGKEKWTDERRYVTYTLFE